MRITVFGATGMAGSEIVKEGLRRGHHITAGARTRRDTMHHERLTPVQIDVADTSKVERLLTTADSAVLTVRMPPGREQEIVDLTESALNAAKTTGTPMFVIGGSAPLRSPNNPSQRAIDDRAFVPQEWVPIASASLEQFEACREHSNQNWTYISPPALFERGNRTGTYRRGNDILLVNPDGTSMISAADFAIAVLDEIEHPSGEQHFTVVSSPM
nr:NAD(P)H-binding protein [Pseudoclavibacter sp. Marseille-Q3772]